MLLSEYPFIYKAVKPVIGEDEVIEHRHVQNPSGFLNLTGQNFVGMAWYELP